MYKKLQIKAWLMLAMMLVGASNVWADANEWSFTFTKGSGNYFTKAGTQTFNNVSWTLATDGGYFSGTENEGLCIGSSSKGATYVTLSTSGISGTVTKIVLGGVRSTNSTTGKINVTVGGDAFGSEATFNKTAGDKTFEGSASGAIVISATNNSKQFQMKSITITLSSGEVETVDVSGISLNQEKLALEVGESATLTATVEPTNATNQNVTWSSSDEDVATIENGMVTAVAAGTATITAKTIDGGFTATCAVTVQKVLSASLTFDFSDTAWGLPAGNDKKVDDGETYEYTNGDYTIQVCAPTAFYLINNDALFLGKNGAMLTLPAFPFNVSKIKVYGRTGSSGKVTFNFFVGEEAVSTEATSSLVNHTFAISEDKQDAGTVYVLKVTNANNAQISKIEIYGYEPVTVGSAGYTTYVPKNNVTLDGATAYVVTDVTDRKITLDEVTEATKGTALIIEAAEGSYQFPVVETADEVAVNLLKAGPVTGDEQTIYALGKKNDKVGFYLVKQGVSVPATKAYLEIAAGARPFIGFDDDTATLIDSIAPEQTAPEQTIYNLNGTPVAAPTRGIYITGGKKIVMK